MFYAPVSSTDNFVQYHLGSACNLTVYNKSLANSIDISSDGQNVDVGTVNPNAALTLDQNSFKLPTIWIRSSVPGASANIQIWAW